MKTFKYFLAYPILIFCYSTIYGQLNLPLKFTSDESKWIELTWIDGNKKSDQSFENRVPPIIIGDTAYLFMNYLGFDENGISIGYSGYSIKKMNIQTGQKYWEIQRMYKNGSKRKALSEPTIKDNKLTITLYDEASTTGTDWTECYPAHIVIDPKIGTIIDSQYVDRNDTGLPKFLSIAGSVNQNSSVNPKIILNDTSYIIRYFWSWFNPELKSGILNRHTNSKGYLTSSDTLPLNTLYYLYDLKYYETGEGITAFVVSEQENWRYKDMKIVNYNEEGELVDSFNVTKYYHDSIGTYGAANFDNGFYITGSFLDNLTLRTRKITYHMFDRKGNLLDIIKYTLKSETDEGIKYGWLNPMVDKVNKRLLLTHSRQNKLSESTFFELFASHGDTIIRLKRIEVEGIKDHFRIEFVTMLENGDILMYIAQFAWTDPNTRWHSWIMLDGQKMNIISSTKDEQANSRKLKLYPNPTSGSITINGLEGEANVSIKNINGQILYESKTLNSQIDISVLRAGMYIIEIENGNLREWHKVVKSE
ncbi:MAG: T9SS type A sorting domain-containing protein [Saprospiraceae bacterium]|nr:T9SS type A sorting domain-containing protein [Saprospiraceae bacterium]